MASYGGLGFGPAASVTPGPAVTAGRTDATQGVPGVLAQWAGGRGRVLVVRGVVVGGSEAELNAWEDSLRALDDGEARDLVDDRGRVWSQVVFRGEVETGPTLANAAGGWACTFSARFYWLGVSR